MITIKLIQTVISKTSENLSVNIQKENLQKPKSWHISELDYVPKFQKICFLKSPISHVNKIFTKVISYPRYAR